MPFFGKSVSVCVCVKGVRRGMEFVWSHWSRFLDLGMHGIEIEMCN